MNVQKKKTSLGLKIILPLLILLIGFAGFNMMGKWKKTPKKQRPAQQGILVDVIELQAHPHQIKVYANGTVQPEQEIELVPEVSGKVSWISPLFVSGGFFKKGDLLIKIEADDYQLVLEKARADIARAEVSLATERERARVATDEWNRVDIPDKGQPGPLVTREIQMRQEQANLGAAKANLRQAELNLKRTELRAPFNGRIRQEQVGLGQYLRAGSSIATFAGTDRAEIHVPLTMEKLQWLSIPRNRQQSGAQAAIYLPEEDQSYWHGELTRSLGEIDPNSRMATVVVTVQNPYQLDNSAQHPVLPNGQFVEIEFTGKKLGEVISIPRKALHSGNQVWVVDNNNRLKLRTVEILRREKEQILLKNGVTAGEKLILTNISGAAEGVLLRPVMGDNR